MCVCAGRVSVAHTKTRKWVLPGRTERGKSYTMYHNTLKVVGSNEEMNHKDHRHKAGHTPLAKIEVPQAPTATPGTFMGGNKVKSRSPHMIMHSSTL